MPGPMVGTGHSRCRCYAAVLVVLLGDRAEYGVVRVGRLHVGGGHDDRLQQVGGNNLVAVVVGLVVVDLRLLAGLQVLDHGDGVLNELAGVLVDGGVLLAGKDGLDRLNLGVLAGDHRDRLAGGLDGGQDRAGQGVVGGQDAVNIGA